MTKAERIEHEKTVLAAATFFGRTPQEWTVRRANQLKHENIRGHSEFRTASLVHETSPSRSWAQANNGVFELLTTSVSGEIEDAQ